MSIEVINNIKNAERFFIKKPFYHPYNIGISIALLYTQSFDTYVNVGVSGSHFLIPLTKLYKKVIGFEPDPLYHTIIDEISDYPNIECHNIALSNCSTPKTFYRVGNDGASSFNSKDWWTQKYKDITPINITPTTLDIFLLERNVGTVDYLKIDAEDEDPLILEGSINTIEKHRPIIQIETVNENTYSILHKLDYVEYIIDLSMFPRDIKNKKIDKYFIHKSIVKQV